MKRFAVLLNGLIEFESPSHSDAVGWAFQAMEDMRREMRMNDGEWEFDTPSVAIVQILEGYRLGKVGLNEDGEMCEDFVSAIKEIPPHADME